MDFNLSPNLTLREVIRSPTAERLGISNIPNELQIQKLIQLAENVFQPTRDYFGHPIFISSGFRAIELNRKVGGVTGSQHTFGEAIDINQNRINSPISNREIFDHIMNNIEFDQLIWESGSEENPNWVHVSYREENNRNRVIYDYDPEFKKGRSC